MIDIIARAALGAVFIFAGIAKLRTPHWAVLAMEGGTPRSVVIGLPTFEVLLGLALVLQVLPGLTTWVALLVLLAFTATLIYRMQRGSKAPCNCFGGKSNDPVKKADVARNVLLMALAVVALA